MPIDAHTILATSFDNDASIQYTMTTQKVDMLLEGRSQVSRFQPFASSLYNVETNFVFESFLVLTVSHHCE